MSKEFLKICYDQQAFVMQKYGGVSRYFADLIFNIKNYSNVEIILPFKFHQNAYLNKNGVGISNSFINKLKIYYLNKFVKIKHIYNQCDIYHGTYYYGVPQKSKLCRAKIVSTLHDMTPEKLKKYFKGHNPHKNKIDWFDKSDLIISVSDSSKNDLLNMYPKLERKVKRIHLNSSFCKKSPSRKPSSSFFNGKELKPYFLYVGGRGGYKNDEIILDAFQKFKDMKGPETLIFASSKPFSMQELKRISDYGIQKYILNLQVDDHELWFLYKNASALLVPSLAEGFSLPLIEGLVADIPIIASDIEVHKEISSSFAYNINPVCFDDWIDLMMLKSKIKPSQRLKGKYTKLTNYFSAERLGEETLNTYKNLF